MRSRFFFFYSAPVRPSYVGVAEVTKRLVELTSDAQKLLTFVDAGIREHYGTRSEKLVEFGRQPFRSQPRVKLVGPDGKPVKPGPPRWSPRHRRRPSKPSH